MLNKLTDLPEYKALLEHKKSLDTIHLNDLFSDDHNRFDAFHLELESFLFDYSKQKVNAESINLLLDLARARSVEAMRDQMFAGAPINTSEDRAVLHTALRGSTDNDIEVDEENVSNWVNSVSRQIKKISNALREDKTITDIVNIGIGGSDLGPAMVCGALSNFADGPAPHFVSNADGTHIEQTLKGLSPENTAFIIASKTFTTQETITNALAARQWLIDAGVKDLSQHLYAVSNNIEAATNFGVNEENILPMRDWIGGRYSLWGAIGLPIATSIGFDHFTAFLSGARTMDEHFKTAPLEKNIPVLAAMIGIWNRNILEHDCLAILPYAQNLNRLPAYLQQLDMESNGKSVTRDGDIIDYATGPIVFGEPGTNGQHAFYQLLHQGNTIVPADFIAFKTPLSGSQDHHNKLLANALAQAQALMQGKQNSQSPARHFAGQRPSSFILLDRLDPYHLGMLLAFYEHKVFIQGIIWDINSFDQWGVELGKILANNILQNIAEDKKITDIDSSTLSLLQRIKKKA